MLLLLFCLNLLTSNHAAKNLTKPKLFDLGNLGKLPGQIAADLSNWWAQAQAPGTVVTIGEENVDVCKTIKRLLKNLPNVQNSNEGSCDKFCQNNGFVWLETVKGKRRKTRLGCFNVNQTKPLG